MLAGRHWVGGLVVVLAVVAARAEAPADVDSIVGAVQARFDATADLRADVEQEVAMVSLGRSMSARGTVVFKRPGKMRWELNGDEKQTIVADGGTVWFYQPADQQVLKAPLGTVFRSTTPVSFLTGVGKIADDFRPSILEKTEDEIVLLLEPKRSGGDVGRLELVVSAEDHDFRGAKITDPIGNVTVLTFSNLRRNTGVPDEEFRFEVPPGVDVVSY